MMAVLSQLTQGLMLSLWTHANLRSILLVGCVLLLTYWFVSSRGWSNCPPGPWGWPVLGNLLSLRQYPFKTLAALGRQYGDVFRVKMGNMEVVVLNSYTAIREALVKKAADFSSRPYSYMPEEKERLKHGRRACLGEHLARMELFIFFTHLMYHFTFTLPEGASTPSAIGTGGLLLKPFTCQTCATIRK